MTLNEKLDRKKVMRSLVMVLAFGFLCLQVFRWQTYAFEVTWLSLKSVVGHLSFTDRLRFGSICNSIQNYECSVEQFEQALLENPKHLSAMGNLAIAQSQLENSAAAQTSFERYFSGGGLAYDVMYYYAQYLIGQGRLEAGIDWLYRSLSVHTANQAVANELIDRLTVGEKFYEALSLTGALIEGDPTAADFWKSKQQSLVQFLEAHLNESAAKGKDAVDPNIRILTLDGKSFYVPVKYDATTPWSLFLVDRAEPEIVINNEILSKWSYQLYENLKKKQTDPKSKIEFELKQMRVGPWELENVKAVLCESCPPRLGRSIYSHLDIRKGQDQIMDFIIIQPEKKEE